MKSPRGRIGTAEYNRARELQERVAEDRKGRKLTYVKMGKEKLVKAIVSVRQSWVEQTGVSKLFATAGMSLDKEGILGIPVTKWDVSSPGFVEVVFYPRVLKGHRDIPTVANSLLTPVCSTQLCLTLAIAFTNLSLPILALFSLCSYGLYSAVTVRLHGVAQSAKLVIIAQNAAFCACNVVIGISGNYFEARNDTGYRSRHHHDAPRHPGS